jgi:hypothetical protein
MSSRTIEIDLGKEITSAMEAHTHKVAEAATANYAWDVSPMTWNGTNYVCTITFPEEPEDEDEDEPDETAHQAEVLEHINVSDVLRETAELLLDDDLSSPLVQQIGAWLEDPMTAIDPKHLPLREYAAVGRHVLGLAAAVLERQLQAAQGRLGNVAL